MERQSEKPPRHWTRIAKDATTGLAEVGRRPPLLAGETLLTMQRGVGLYDGAARCAAFDSGACWTSSHRILWISDTDGDVLALSLERIFSVAVAGGFGQFMPAALKSSPKITLTLSNNLTSSTAELNGTAPETSTSNVTWKCSICDAYNPDNIRICAQCGVKRDPSASSSSTAQLPQPLSASEKQCPVCTFINHSDVFFCEACDSRFPSAQSSSKLESSALGSKGSLQSASAQNALDDDDLTVKLSFRQGGISEFAKALKAAISSKEWEKTQKSAAEIDGMLPSSLESATRSLNISSSGGGGISGIIKKVDQTNQVLDKTLTNAFQDLDALMSKASDMTKMAQSISARLAAASSSNSGGALSVEDPELIAFRSFLVDLGISSPVTKEMTGDAYTQELAKELSEFLGKVIKRYGGIIALTDLYCIFNRARGVALISPQDLQKSVAQFERMRLPFRMRKFDSGLLVVHSSDYSDDAIATRILNHIQSAKVASATDDWGAGLTSLDVASREGVSIVLAKELLLITEKYGLICRDDSVEGIRFYRNSFVETE
ncbi:EAP30/Vps36 family-domain-containing protein [Chytriomyces cf. hyalinus JEL632]|nr:EAP30/Vps36 family-domain-containing protein [Chytriomyces cf. hyalinus JEL632]